MQHPRLSTYVALMILMISLAGCYENTDKAYANHDDCYWRDCCDCCCCDAFKAVEALLEQASAEDDPAAMRVAVLSALAQLKDAAPARP